MPYAPEGAGFNIPSTDAHDARCAGKCYSCSYLSDLSICTANLSVFPSERGEEIIKNIQANEKQIRYELGTRVRNQLRIIPELRFFIDDSLDYLERIDELLKK